MNQQPPSTAPPTPEQGLMITEEMVIKKITHVLKVYGPGEASQLIKDYKKVLVDYPGWKATENKLEQILLNYQEEQRKAKEQEHEMMCQVMAAMMSAVQPAQEKAAKGDRTPVTLPPELSTDRAMMLWRVLQEAGLVNDNYQPTVSRTKASVMAGWMFTKLEMEVQWSLFEKLWKRENMRSDHSNALDQKQTKAFMETLESLLPKHQDPDPSAQVPAQLPRS